MITRSELPGSTQITFGSFGPLHRLFGKVWFIATRFRKHLLERCLPLRVVTGVPLEALFDDLLRDRLVPNIVGMGIDACLPRQPAYQEKAHTLTGVFDLAYD